MKRISSFVLASVAASAALFLTACGSHNSAADKSHSPTTTHDPRLETPLVRIATVQREKEAARSFTGVIIARVQSDLGFRVPGKIVQRLVDVGQTVKRGQPLMRIDSAELELTVAARAADVEAAKARSIQASADEARLRSLVKSGVVSAQSYDLAKAAADSALAQLTAAEAQVRVARNYSDYSVLLADVDGTVMSIPTEPGQVVQAGQVVIRLAQAGPREASVSLPESLRPQLGSPAEAKLYGSREPGAGSPAWLRQLSDSADPVTRTFEARYVLKGAMANAPLGSTVTVSLTSDSVATGAAEIESAPVPAKAKPNLVNYSEVSYSKSHSSKSAGNADGAGSETEKQSESQTASASPEASTQANAGSHPLPLQLPVAVPLGAVYDAGSGAGPGVWVIDEHTATVSFRPVEIGRLTEETAVLTHGVSPGERVVSLGAHMLHEGQKVRLNSKNEVALR